MQMCNGTGLGSTSGNSTIKSGITCNTCGGLGHYSRNCPSKSRVTTGPTVKVNVAVTKVRTRDEYNKYLPETRRQAGNCPGCNQPAHNYQRQFPFGMANWPSTRLDTCQTFMGMSARERGKLIERLKGCYRCTSWQHQGDNCYTRSKSTCSVVTAGVTCGGVHHKLLHGSGVAFCHKILVQVASTGSVGIHGS